MPRKTLLFVVTLALLSGGAYLITSAFDPSAEARDAQAFLDSGYKQIGHLGPLQPQVVREHGRDVTWYFGECVHPADPTLPTVTAVFHMTHLVKVPSDPGTKFITVYVNSAGGVRAEDDLRYYAKARPKTTTLAIGAALVLLGLAVGLFARGTAAHKPPT